MKTKLPATFPKAKKKELDQIVGIIQSNARVEMVILYGSYARGDFVEKEEYNDKTKSVFKSDFDLFIVTRSKDWQDKVRGWTLKANDEFKRNGIKTVVQFAVDNIQFTNKMLKLGQYFHKDIYKEGVLLFDSGEYKLNQPREYLELDPQERLEQAEKSFKLFLKKNATNNLKTFEFHFKEKMFEDAAFNLHQSAEKLLHCTELVFAGYKPPSHNLLELKGRNQKFIPNLKNFFFDEGRGCTCGKKVTPCLYKSQQGLEKICVNCNDKARIFLLLATAYVDARYSDDYAVSVEELQAMKADVLKLRGLVEKSCGEEIEKLKKGCE